MIDRVAASVRVSGDSPVVSKVGISISTEAVGPGERSIFGAMFAVGSGATTLRIVGLSSPQSIDQFPRAIAEDANSFTSNMLTTAKNSENNAYHSNRHGR